MLCILPTQSIIFTICQLSARDIGAQVRCVGNNCKCSTVSLNNKHIYLASRGVVGVWPTSGVRRLAVKLACLDSPVLYAGPATQPSPALG